MALSPRSDTPEFPVWNETQASLLQTQIWVLGNSRIKRRNFRARIQYWPSQHWVYYKLGKHREGLLWLLPYDAHTRVTHFCHPPHSAKISQKCSPDVLVTTALLTFYSFPKKGLLHSSCYQACRTYEPFDSRGSFITLLKGVWNMTEDFWVW